ncbi:hypothetical protein QE152_g15853 [Popillia japonica]|uniref:Uncharacterized protein n=1 Tax=Popillia japonica TaxID=7064 RepID=A0AAW1L4L6_POPJA
MYHQRKQPSDMVYPNLPYIKNIVMHSGRLGKPPAIKPQEEDAIAQAILIAASNHFKTLNIDLFFPIMKTFISGVKLDQIKFKLQTPSCNILFVETNEILRTFVASIPSSSSDNSLQTTRHALDFESHSTENCSIPAPVFRKGLQDFWGPTHVFVNVSSSHPKHVQLDSYKDCEHAKQIV